jgi:hypothetical protein
MSAGCRIGRIRFKSGGELRLLPSAVERDAVHLGKWFDYHGGQIGEEYAKDMAGYVIAAWARDGEHTVRLRCVTGHPDMNSLPHWLAEAVRREIAHFDLKRRLDLPPGTN